MNLSLIKEKIKDSINHGADKFISAKVRDELGLNRPSMELLQSLSEDHDLNSDLSTFFKPVNSNFHSAKNYKNIQAWVIGAIVVLTLALIGLFFTMIIPHSNYTNSLGDSQVIVNGKTIKDADKDSSKAFSGNSKVHEPDPYDKVVSEELKVDNVKVSEPELPVAAKQIKEEPQVLKGGNIQHIVRPGDTLEAIAAKYYGNSNYQNIDKLKRANQIRNSRLINVGQRIVVPN